MPNRMSTTGFERLVAADRLRLLLADAQIEIEIPSALHGLPSFAPSNQTGKASWEDGPQALTESRNLLVHPTKKLRAPNIPPEAIRDTGELGVWYLQLALLFLLGYRDVYLSRVEGWTGRPVPWILNENREVSPNSGPPCGGENGREGEAS